MKTITIQFHPMDDVNYDELLKVVPDHALNPRLCGMAPSTAIPQAGAA